MLLEAGSNFATMSCGQLTKENRSNSRMIIASAGSGKTYCITQEVIRKLNSIKENTQLLATLRQMLIMTFTNKATDELRQRIIDELKKVSGDLYNTFLFHHRALTISTIDSLLYEIIKPLLLLVKKDNPANLIVNEGEIVADVVERLLVKASSGEGDFREIIQRISTKKMVEGKKVRLDKELNQLVRQYLKFKGRGIKIYSPKENTYKELKDAVDDWIKKVYYDIYREVRDIMEKVAMVYKNTLDVDIRTIPAFNNKTGFNGQKAKKFDVLVKFLHYDADSISYEELKDMINTLKTGKVIERFLWHKEINGNVKNLFEDIVADKKKNLFHKRWQDEYAAWIKPLSIPKEIFNVIDFVRFNLLDDVFAIYFWYQINETIKDILTERHSILLRNIPEILKDLLSTTGGNLPYVYEYTGSRFVRYYTDEFQDTSLPQYEALKPLWEEAVSQDGEVIVVGDIKQSIYQWRDADPLIMANRFKTDFKPVEESLSSNWRSSPVIVDFNNYIFGQVIPQKIKENWKELIDYQNSKSVGEEKGFNLGKMLDKWYADSKVRQEAKRSYDGTVEVRQLIVSGNTSSLNKKDKQVIIVEDVIRVIDRLVKQKGFKYGDITILFRKDKTLKFFAAELLSRGYPVRVTAGIGLKHEPSSLVMQRILEGVFHKRSTGIVPELIVVEISSLLCRVSSSSDVDRRYAKEIFDKLHNNKDQLWTEKESFSSLSEMALTLAYKFMNIFPELKNNPKWIEGMQAFLNFVRMAERKGINTLQDLLEHWDSDEHVFDLTEDDTTSQGQISLMTIHKAKGLQNKVILVPDLYDWQLELDSKKDTWIPVPVKALRKFVEATSKEVPSFEYINDDEYVLMKVPSSEKLSTLRKFDSIVGEKYGVSGIVNAFTEFEARYIFEVLNLLYVGFTRPEQALFLWIVVEKQKESAGGNKEQSSKKLKSVEDLVNYLVTEPSVKFEIRESREIQESHKGTVQLKLFIKGNCDELKPNDSKEDKKIQTKSLGENQTWKAYPDKYFDVNLPVNKTTIKDFHNFPIVQGTYLHKLVAQAKTTDDVEKFNIDENSKTKLKRWLEHTELKNLQDWKVETEVPLFHNKQLFYVDRIYTNPNNEVVIVDFKSVDDPSQSPYWNKWEEQVRTYAEILRQQGRNVKGAYVVGFKKVATVNLEA